MQYALRMMSYAVHAPVRLPASIGVNQDAITIGYRKGFFTFNAPLMELFHSVHMHNTAHDKTYETTKKKPRDEFTHNAPPVFVICDFLLRTWRSNI
jgi:hypothetical protein